MRLHMNKLNKSSLLKRDNISKEVLSQQRKTVLRELNYTDLKNLGLLQK